MQNIEYKAELRDTDLARALCGSFAAHPVSVLEQIDTYYRVPDAKLKRRECVGYEPEWIFYSRPNRLQPKLSNFTIYSDAQARMRFGTQPLPVRCIIRKKRELYMTTSGVRIHLDEVEGIGAFIEFEALICPERNLGECHREIERLKRAFAPAMGEPISSGYADLCDEDSAPTADSSSRPTQAEPPASSDGADAPCE
ncbi:MAG: CYTH domain-containing protein [Phycisphaeraceae bacterium]|nr:CYTH domain-containing protein [Phycisphaeraceae bacterium]